MEVYGNVSIGNTICDRFVFEFFVENEHGFCVLSLSFNGQSTKTFLFSSSFPRVF